MKRRFGVLAAAVVTCMGCQEQPAEVGRAGDKTPKAISQQPAEVGPAVNQTLKGISQLQANVSKLYPRAAIKNHTNITDDLIKTGLMPTDFIKGGEARNAWTGKILVQAFPANAWRSGVPETISYVFESVPKKECSEMISRLGGESSKKIFQINLEPSKKLHSTFPFSGDDGCADGINNIGYAVFAE